MRIGKIELRWDADVDIVQDKIDRSHIFAVPENEPWWLAVHQAINEIERETIDAARRYTKSTNECIAAVGAGEGVAMVRLRLLEKRENALRKAG
jgi:hypothetical protein